MHFEGKDESESLTGCRERKAKNRWNGGGMYSRTVLSNTHDLCMRKSGTRQVPPRSRAFSGMT